MQIKQRLALVLTLMAMVPLLILLLRVVDKVEDDIEQRISIEIHKTLSKLVHEIRTELSNQRSIAFGLAKVPVVKEFANLGINDKSRVYDRAATRIAAFFLNYQSTVPSIQALRFTDLKGRTLVKVKEGRLIPVKKRSVRGRFIVGSIRDKPFFKRAIKSSQNISVSNFERGKVTGEVEFCPAMVRYTVPLYDDLDVKLGMLIVNMWGRRVDDAVEAALGGTPGSAYIVEINSLNKKRDGIYLYHKQSDKRFADQQGTDFRFSKDLGPDLWGKIKSDSSKGKVANKGRLIFYRSYLPYKDRDTKWLLVIDISREEMLTPVSKLRNSIAVLIVFVLIFSLVIARWIASWLARPVQQMSHLMTRYADGEKQLRYQGKRSDEIESVGQAFNYLSNKLETAEQDREQAEAAVRQSERLAAIGQMAAGIGHEINNPLMNINSLAQLIQKSVGEDDEQLSSDLNTMRQEVKRCARIVQGILNFAKETDAEYKEFDLVLMLSESIGLYQHQARNENINIHLTGEKSLLINGDRSQLQQVFVNIISNALYASASGGKINVDIALKDLQCVSIEISDEGSGILPEHLSQLFDPFFSTKEEGEGTGLGLSVSYGIIQKHQGEVFINNRKSKGVRVMVRLPVAKGEGIQ